MDTSHSNPVSWWVCFLAIFCRTALWNLSHKLQSRGKKAGMCIAPHPRLQGTSCGCIQHTPALGLRVLWVIGKNILTIHCCNGVGSAEELICYAPELLALVDCHTQVNPWVRGRGLCDKKGKCRSRQLGWMEQLQCSQMWHLSSDPSACKRSCRRDRFSGFWLNWKYWGSGNIRFLHCWGFNFLTNEKLGKYR